MGTWHPPPSLASSARSAETQVRAAAWSNNWQDSMADAVVRARLDCQSALPNRRAHIGNLQSFGDSRLPS